MPSLIQRKSFGSVRVFWLDREGAVTALRERAEVRTVILFGSLAEGRATPGSDADLLILLESAEGRPMDRPLRYLDAFADAVLPIDLLCFTAREAEGMPAAGRAIETGQVLAGGPSRPAPPA